MDNPVYESIKRFAGESRHVVTDMESIEKTAKVICDLEFEYPVWRFDCLPEADDVNTLEFFFLINCVNFKFWYSDTKERFSATVGKKYYGAFAMFALLKKWYTEEPALLTGEYLREMDIETAREKLTGDSAPIPMLSERVEVLKEAGRVLTEKYGSFYDLVKASSFRCFNHGSGIVERLVRDFPSFRDEYTYNGEKLIINKRAQLAPAMAYARFRGTDMAPLKDIEKLTAFADYQVPKGLLMYDILRFSEELREKIDKRVMLPRGSREELEIRANTIYGVEKLIKKINLLRGVTDEINAVQMDYHLWKRARDNPRPYHLTETIAY